MQFQCILKQNLLGAFSSGNRKTTLGKVHFRGFHKPPVFLFQGIANPPLAGKATWPMLSEAVVKVGVTGIVIISGVCLQHSAAWLRPMTSYLAHM